MSDKKCRYCDRKVGKERDYVGFRIYPYGEKSKAHWDYAHLLCFSRYQFRRILEVFPDIKEEVKWIY